MWVGFSFVKGTIGTAERWERERIAAMLASCLWEWVARAVAAGCVVVVVVGVRRLKRAAAFPTPSGSPVPARRYECRR